MQEGTVKFYNESKGFGFITPVQGGKDIFVHSTGILGRISENDSVTFQVEETPKGLSAIQVRRA